MQTSTIITILTAIGALCSALTAPVLEAAFPGHGNYIAALLAIVAISVGVVLNAIKAQAPASSIIENAPVVPEGTVMAPAKTPPQNVPTVLSTTTNLIPQPAAPPQGT